MYPAQPGISPSSSALAYLRLRRHLFWAASSGPGAVESLFARYPAPPTLIRVIPAHPETLPPLHIKDRSDTLRSSSYLQTVAIHILRKQRLLSLTQAPVKAILCDERSMGASLHNFIAFHDDNLIRAADG